MEALVGDKVIEVKAEAGLLTVTTAALLFMPCADAVICDVPAARPLADPELLIVTALGFVLDHTNAIPVMVAPFWS